MTQLTLEPVRPVCAVTIDFRVRTGCTLAEWVTEVALVASAAWPVVQKAVAA